MSDSYTESAPRGTMTTSRDLAKHPGLSVKDLEVFLDDARGQPNWRINAEIEADYYDGNQLDNATIALMESRGIPPIITNYIKPTVDVVLGMEAKTRTDWVVRADKPGDKEADAVATALSVKLKEAERLSGADQAVSDAYAAQIKIGLGWVEVGRESDPFRPKYRVKPVHRREIWWDWRGTDPDLLDARYLIRKKFYDDDQIVAFFPKHEELIRNCASGWPSWEPERLLDTGLARDFQIERDFSVEATEWRDMTRRRLCLYETWYRLWVRGHILRLPNERIVEYNPQNEMHLEAVGNGLIKPEAAVYSKVRLSWWIGPHRVADLPSPYPHNYFPYVPLWGYREDRTATPYGLVRGMKGPQDEINARRSKMLWLLSAKMVTTDDDAVKNKDHASVQEEVSRGDAYIILNENRKNVDGFKVKSDFQLADQQYKVMEEAKQAVQDTGGVFQSMMGKRDTGADSGVAINQLIEQGTMTLAEINDNYQFARRQVGNMLASLVKEDLDKQQDVPVMVERPGGRKERILLNHPEQDEFGREFRTNDVLRTQTMVELEDVPSTPTYRREMLRSLMEMTKNLPPEVQAVVMPLVIESTDLPNRKLVADLVRGALGVAKDPEDMTDEERTAADAEQQEQEAMKQLSIESILKEIEEMAAKVEKLKADAALATAKTEQTQVQTERTAVETAHYARDPSAFARSKPGLQNATKAA